MTLEVHSQEEKGVAVVTPRGRLILENGSLLHDKVKHLVKNGAQRVLVDLSHLDYIDSYGLGQLVACHTTVRQHKGKVRFAGMSEKLYRLVEMTRMPRILVFDRKPATALRRLCGS